MKPRRLWRRARRAAKLLVFALVPGLVLVVAAELLARHALTDPGLRERVLGRLASPEPDTRAVFMRLAELLEPDPNTGFRLRPSADPTSRRPPTPPFPVKAPGEVRILCLGDSVAYGVLLAEQEAWPARLQEYLHTWAPEGIRFEVYNGAVPGYSPQQAKRLYQTRYLGLEPDLVLWQESVMFPDAIEPPTALKSWRVRLSFLAYRSHLLYLLWVLRTYVLTGEDPYDPPVRLDADYRKNVMPEFIAWCRARGVAVFLVVESVGIVENTDGTLTLAGKPILREMGIRYVPTYPDFPKDPAAFRPLFFDRVHLTAAGADLFARIVSDDLRRRWPAIESDLAAGRGR